MSTMSTLLIIASVGACLGATARAGTLAVWPVDPHIKVFRDTEPPAQGESKTPSRVVRLRAARNEYEPAQIAVRSPKALKGVRVELSPLRHEGGKGIIGGDDLAWNFLGFIPLKKNTRDSEKMRLRAAPCDVPDPLLETRTLDLPANSTQPVWLTVRVPKAAAPGLYRGEVAVAAGC